jgi:hypothetical protein
LLNEKYRLRQHAVEKDSLTPQAITLNNDNGISHISFFGVTDGGAVPEPATALIWSLLIGMGVAHWRYR